MPRESCGGSTSSSPVVVVLKLLVQGLASAIPFRSRMAVSRRTVKFMSWGSRLVMLSLNCHTATVRSLTVSKRTSPGSRLSDSSYTLNAPPAPVVIVSSRISSLKNATTGELVEMPSALGAGTTLTAGAPSGPSAGGGRVPAAQPSVPTKTSRLMFWSAAPTQELMNPPRNGRMVNTSVTVSPGQTWPRLRTSGPSMESHSGTPASSSKTHETSSPSPPTSMSRLA